MAGWIAAYVVGAMVCFGVCLFNLADANAKEYKYEWREQIKVARMWFYMLPGSRLSLFGYIIYHLFIKKKD